MMFFMIYTFIEVDTNVYSFYAIYVVLRHSTKTSFYSLFQKSWSQWRDSVQTLGYKKPLASFTHAEPFFILLLLCAGLFSAFTIHADRWPVKIDFQEICLYLALSWVLKVRSPSSLILFVLRANIYVSSKSLQSANKMYWWRMGAESLRITILAHPMPDWEWGLLGLGCQILRSTFLRSCGFSEARLQSFWSSSRNVSTSSTQEWQIRLRCRSCCCYSEDLLWKSMWSILVSRESGLQYYDPVALSHFSCSSKIRWLARHFGWHFNNVSPRRVRSSVLSLW